MNGEAADEVVRMVVNGSEVAIRLTGSAAKNLAAILVAWSKNHKKVYGKTSMMKLLRSGEELQVLSMTKEQYLDFKASARKQVLFAPFVDDTPSRRSSSGARQQPEARQPDRSRPTEEQHNDKKPSVLAQLEANQRLVEQREQEASAPVRRKKKAKDDKER